MISRWLLAAGIGAFSVAGFIAGCRGETNSRPTGSAPYVTPNQSITSGPAVDNTGSNKRDDGSTMTPMDQGLGEEDIAMTRTIRAAVIADSSVSVNGQNVKIITKDRHVTLRGPVASAAERTTIVGIATAKAGVGMVNDHLDVVAR